MSKYELSVRIVSFIVVIFIVWGPFSYVEIRGQLKSKGELISKGQFGQHGGQLWKFGI